MLHRVAGGLILDGGRVLLGRRSASRTFEPNVWDVFGGHIEPGEQPDDTLARELEEELGITVTRATLLIVLRETHPHSGDEIEFHLYVVTLWKGTPENRQPAEHSAIQWFTLCEAQALDLAAPDYRSIFQMLEGGHLLDLPL